MITQYEGAMDDLFTNDGPSREFAEMLPEQFWGSQHTDWRGEHWLMFRVLEDAINCHLQGRDSHVVKRVRRAREAQAWLMAEDYAWPFSFVNICHTLGIDPRYLLRGISRIQATRLYYSPQQKTKSDSKKSH